MTDESMVKLLRQKDERAFEYCYNQYIRLVFHEVIRIVKSYEAAEEISQNVFLKMYNNIHQFNGQYFKAWLLKIAKNESLNYLRLNKRSVEYADYLVIDELSATTNMIELLRDLEDILTPYEYEIVIMRNLYNMRNKEIASYFGKSEASVSETYKTALNKFKERNRKSA